MLDHPAAVRAGFNDGAAAYLATLIGIGDDRWEHPSGVGAWTVRELAGHTLRAVTTVETYLSGPPVVDRVIVDTVEYFTLALGQEGVHAGVAARGREAGLALRDPVGEAEATMARVLALVASTPDDDPVNSRAGQMTLIEYLGTRCVELAVHTLDLQRATGQPLDVPADTSATAIAALLDLASPVALLLALTGRSSLPDGYNVLG